MALVTSPPCKVFGVVPSVKSTVKVRDGGGISVLQCLSMVLAETPRSYVTPLAT
jgi:hypothetical protein